LALKKSSNAEVKAFAQDMITAHTKAQAELKALAQAKGIKIADKPGADQRLQYNKLTTLSGAAFDAEYKKVQVDGHTMTLKLIQTYRTVAKDAQAGAYAAKT
jgi:putative membrane protein